MTPTEFMKSVLRTDVTAEDPARQFEHAVIGVGSESGELLDIVKKARYYGKLPDKLHRLEEWGDMLWYVALGLSADGFTFEQAFEANVAKLRARYPERFAQVLALNRDLAGERKAMSEVAEKTGAFNKPATDLQDFQMPMGDMGLTIGDNDKTPVVGLKTDAELGIGELTKEFAK